MVISPSQIKTLGELHSIIEFSAEDGIAVMHAEQEAVEERRYVPCSVIADELRSIWLELQASAEESASEWDRLTLLAHAGNLRSLEKVLRGDTERKDE